MADLHWGCHHYCPEKPTQRFAMKQVLATGTGPAFSAACELLGGVFFKIVKVLAVFL